MSEVEPLSPAGLPSITTGTAAPSSGGGGSLVLDTNPYQSVFANSLSNGNRNNVAGLQQPQYRDAAPVSPNTTISK